MAPGVGWSAPNTRVCCVSLLGGGHYESDGAYSRVASEGKGVSGLADRYAAALFDLADEPKTSAPAPAPTAASSARRKP
jgi:hypothetical protein